MYLPGFLNLDLFSAGVHALNGMLVARNPSHNRGYTAAGLPPPKGQWSRHRWKGERVYE
jgi:hypothetical protein